VATVQDKPLHYPLVSQLFIVKASPRILLT